MTPIYGARSGEITDDYSGATSATAAARSLLSANRQGKVHVAVVTLRSAIYDAFS